MYHGCTPPPLIFIMGETLMPNTGVTDSEWKHRLEQYALGTCQFHRVQRPGKFSQWANELAKVEKCPLHWNIHGCDPFGWRLTCSCGYHKVFLN